MQQGLNDEALGVDRGRAAHAACDLRFPSAFEDEDEDATELRG